MTLLDFTRRARPQLSKVGKSKFRKRRQLCLLRGEHARSIQGSRNHKSKNDDRYAFYKEHKPATVRCRGITSPKRTTVLHFAMTKIEKSQATQIEKSQATPLPAVSGACILLYTSSCIAGRRYLTSMSLKFGLNYTCGVLQAFIFLAGDSIQKLSR